MRTRTREEARRERAIGSRLAACSMIYAATPPKGGKHSRAAVTVSPGVRGIVA